MWIRLLYELSCKIFIKLSVSLFFLNSSYINLIYISYILQTKIICSVVSFSPLYWHFPVLCCCILSNKLLNAVYANLNLSNSIFSLLFLLSALISFSPLNLMIPLSFVIFIPFFLSLSPHFLFNYTFCFWFWCITWRTLQKFYDSFSFDIVSRYNMVKKLLYYELFKKKN